MNWFGKCIYLSASVFVVCILSFSPTQSLKLQNNDVAYEDINSNSDESQIKNKILSLEDFINIRDTRIALGGSCSSSCERACKKAGYCGCGTELRADKAIELEKYSELYAERGNCSCLRTCRDPYIQDADTACDPERPTRCCRNPKPCGCPGAAACPTSAMNYQRLPGNLLPALKKEEVILKIFQSEI